MIVVGAGMAGLLAANMLGNKLECVVEKQDTLPNNHSAVLRFRSDGVSNVLNIPFRRVEMLKATQPWRNPVADALAYSHKTLGTSRLRSSIEATGELRTRFIAPENFIVQMYDNVCNKIMFECDLVTILFENEERMGKGLIHTSPIMISTIPMPELMKILDYRHQPEFHSVDAWTTTFRVTNCEAYCSLYIPDPDIPIYRISITGDQVIIEHRTEDPVVDPPEIWTIGKALHYLGMVADRIATPPVTKKQHYAKILPIDEDTRRKFILHATEEYNIYSFGRFATWRPGLLLDDLVNDFRVIMRLIAGETKYEYLIKKQ